MRIQLKKLERQVIVITGASSGIGLATAQLAAARGARVVLASRNEEGLRQAVERIGGDDGRAAYVVADVSKERDVQRVAEIARDEFGGFDTWINNAGVSVYGRSDAVSLADQQRVMDVNFWGIVHGCRVAVPRLRERGGAIINVGSILSDRAAPLQGIYSASKHAVKAYTDSLRMELEEENAPISLTLVKPGAIDTPYYRHAKNYLERAPKPTGFVYAPSVVAKTLLACAERPVRDIVIGGGGKAFATFGAMAPKLTDRYLSRNRFAALQSERAAYDDAESSLHEPVEDDAFTESGGYEGRVKRSSAYTATALRPRLAALAAVGLSLAAVAGIRALWNTEERDDP